MVKKMIVGILLAGCAIRVQAQETGTLLEQLAALRGYIVTAEKGYRLVEEGLHTIGDIRRDEFNLHRTYFASLSAVNPAIKNSPQAMTIVQMEVGMIDSFTRTMGRWRASGWLRATEIGVIRDVYGRLIQASMDNGQQLQCLLSDSVYIATDGERTRAVEKIAATVKEQARYVSGFIRGTDAVIAARRREREETLFLQKWIGNF